jgi:RNA polymerase sigma factor (sigma-70 family)
MRQFRQAQLIDDERLARLVSAENNWAFSILYERYHAMLYRYCHSFLRSEPDALDAVQSTFTRALEALQRGQRDAPLRPWLFRIAHNEAISSLRRRRASEPLAATIARPEMAPEDVVEARESFRSLLADLGQLPARPRGAIVMRELNGLSHDEIAVALGTSRSVVKQAIFEARHALGEFARGRQMACADVRRAVIEGGRRALRGRRIRAHLRDCQECARFAANTTRRPGRLRALTPPAWAGAIAKLLPGSLRPAWSSAAPDPAVASGILGGTAGKLTAILAPKAAVVAAGIAAGATTGMLVDDSGQPTGPGATFAPLRSSAPTPLVVNRRAHGAPGVVAARFARPSSELVVPRRKLTWSPPHAGPRQPAAPEPSRLIRSVEPPPGPDGEQASSRGHVAGGSPRRGPSSLKRPAGDVRMIAPRAAARPRHGGAVASERGGGHDPATRPRTSHTSVRATSHTSVRESPGSSGAATRDGHPGAGARTQPGRGGRPPENGNTDARAAPPGSPAGRGADAAPAKPSQPGGRPH